MDLTPPSVSACTSFENAILCKFILHKGTTLENADSSTYLGVTINKDLK